MLGRIIAIIAVVLLAGCRMMTSKEYLKQQETWQSIGRLGALVECQGALMQQLAVQLSDEKGRHMPPVKEPEPSPMPEKPKEELKK